MVTNWCEQYRSSFPGSSKAASKSDKSVVVGSQSSQREERRRNKNKDKDANKDKESIDTVQKHSEQSMRYLVNEIISYYLLNCSYDLFIINISQMSGR